MGENGGKGWLIVLGSILVGLIAISLLGKSFVLLLEILFFLFVLYI